MHSAMAVNRTLLAAQIVGMLLVFALILFLSAGAVTWLAGWAFLVLFFGFVVALSGWLLRHNPGLLTERMTGVGKADQKAWDKVFYVLLNVIFLVWLIIMPLDAVRFHWSHVPVVLQVFGALLLLCSFAVFFLTFRANSFLSPAVRIQSERDQVVVSTGPYHYVRHPMYAAAAVFLAGTALLLGSWWGLLGGGILMVAVANRAVREERSLRAELHGYAAYMARVKYRLIPRIW